MSTFDSAASGQGISLRQAALIAGLGLLIITFTAPFAEFYVFPTLVIPGDIDRTAQNIMTNQVLYLAGLFAYLITYICDVVVAWALYVLLIPVNRSLALLSAWFRLVYTVIALVALLKLVLAYRILITPDYATIFGTDQLNAQVHLLLNSYRYEWGIGLILFGIHLGLLGFLVYGSNYIPRILGILLAIAGLGYLITVLGRYIFPDANLGFLFITFLFEPVFMIWLLFKGWKIQQPTEHF